MNGPCWIPALQRRICDFRRNDEELGRDDGVFWDDDGSTGSRRRRTFRTMSGVKWIPAFAGMTESWAGMTVIRQAQDERRSEPHRELGNVLSVGYMET